MDSSLAIVAYRCEVGGVPTDSIDIQVRYFVSMSHEEIAKFIQSELLHSYSNDSGETVTWPLVGVLAINTFESASSGSEVVGFITGCDEVVKWAANVT